MLSTSEPAASLSSSTAAARADASAPHGTEADTQTCTAEGFNRAVPRKTIRENVGCKTARRGASALATVSSSGCARNNGDAAAAAAACRARVGFAMHLLFSSTRDL